MIRQLGHEDLAPAAVFSAARRLGIRLSDDDADDLAQDVRLRLLRCGRELAGAEGQAYAGRVARSAIVDMMRAAGAKKRGRYRKDAPLEEAAEVPVRPAQEHAAVARQRVRLLAGELRRIHGDRAARAVLLVASGWTAREAEQLTGTKATTTHTNLHRRRRRTAAGG
jgi:DNA-directed RNA polymerase specialized sigma24 family protein